MQDRMTGCNLDVDENGLDAGCRRDTEAAVERVLREVGRPLAPREVHAELLARGILTRGPYAVRGALGTLAKRGVIERLGVGHRTRYAARASAGPATGHSPPN